MTARQQLSDAAPETMTTTDGIEIADVRKSFDYGRDEVTALDSLNLTVPAGEFLCIVGPSGCGKTTLLRILAGLEQPTTGEVRWTLDAGRNPLRSMVFQNQGVFPWMTVLENVAYGLTVRRVKKAVRLDTARRFVAALGLSRFESAYPAQLSGGMQQRVNIARAFANDPAVLLMDEPFANLDEQTKLILQDDLLRIWDGTRKTVVFITHSLDEAITLGDRVVVLSRRPGRIKSVVDITLPRPRNAIDLRNDHRFVELRQTIWDSLREEVVSLRGGAGQEAS
ncbi:ABC transporter ATP-binding protein [Streptomyces sp. NPDC059909]|uniref:ABC transporter ATP-binding protein n=1 Tax=Streptomyces sp. NPDC059909 TaxID=3346998 RepID=UPI003648F620